MGLGLWPPLPLHSLLWFMVVCWVLIESFFYRSCCSSFRLIYGDFSRLSSWPGHSCHSSLISTFVWNLLARPNNGANPRPVFTYGSGLETDSPRFSLPGDFFTYVFFVATVILVSCELCPKEYCKRAPLSISNCVLPKAPQYCFPTSFFFVYCFTVHLALSARPAYYLVEAVPGSEEDYPCSPHSPYTDLSRAVCAVGMVGLPLR